MNDAVRDEILRIFGRGNFVDRILPQGCRASLKGIHDRLIIDVDSYARNLACASKRCDYVLFFQHGSINKVVCVLIELKSGEYDVDEVVEQLQCTAHYLGSALDLENKIGVGLILCPLLLRTRGPHASEKRKFERATIRYCGSKISIYKGQCGLNGNVIEAIRPLFNVQS